MNFLISEKLIEREANASFQSYRSKYLIMNIWFKYRLIDINN